MAEVTPAAQQLRNFTYCIQVFIRFLPRYTFPVGVDIKDNYVGGWMSAMSLVRSHSNIIMNIPSHDEVMKVYQSDTSDMPISGIKALASKYKTPVIIITETDAEIYSSGRFNAGLNGPICAIIHVNLNTHHIYAQDFVVKLPDLSDKATYDHFMSCNFLRQEPHKRSDQFPTSMFLGLVAQAMPKNYRWLPGDTHLSNINVITHVDVDGSKIIPYSIIPWTFILDNIDESHMRHHQILADNTELKAQIKPNPMGMNVQLYSNICAGNINTYLKYMTMYYLKRAVQKYKTVNLITLIISHTCNTITFHGGKISDYDLEELKEAAKLLKK